VLIRNTPAASRGRTTAVRGGALLVVAAGLVLAMFTKMQFLSFTWPSVVLNGGIGLAALAGVLSLVRRRNYKWSVALVVVWSFAALCVFAAALMVLADHA
jgi:hypothetical protein